MLDIALNWAATALLGAVAGAFLTGWLVLMLWIVREQLDMFREMRSTGATRSEVSYRLMSGLWTNADRATDRDRLFFVLKCVGTAVGLTLVLGGLVLLRNAFVR